MRLSELIGCEVVDVDGEVIGTVHDVVLVQDGPLQGVWGAALRLESLMVGTGSLGTRLGVDRPGAQKPWIVAALFARRRRHEVPWASVANHDSDRITIESRRADLRPIEHPDHEPV